MLKNMYKGEHVTMKEELKSNVISFMNGNKFAYEYIFKEEYAKVYSRIKMNIHFRSEKDIEDVVQDTFLKAYEKIDTLKDVNCFESWLMMIAINTAKNEVIKQNRSIFFEEIPDMDGVTEEDFLENTYMDFQPERAMTQKELKETLMDILSQIPPQQSMCLQMKEYDGLSYQEIADTLQIPLSSVKNNIFYAKKKIKAEVEARKLHSVAPITFFLWMYSSYVEASAASVEMQNAAWLAQVNLLSSSGQNILTGATAVSKVVATQTAKTAAKMTVAKAVAVVGTVSVLGIGGFSIAHTIKTNETNLVQEELEEDDTTQVKEKFTYKQTKDKFTKREEQPAEEQITTPEKENPPVKAEEEKQTQTTNLSIENIYVGSSVEAAEDLRYPGQNHFKTDQPVVHYTIAGKEKSMELYATCEGGTQYELGYELADVTGDGQDDLIVSVYVPGNCLNEMLQDTYIYSIDRKKNDLVQLLKIEADGCEVFAPGFRCNIGVYAEKNGIRLDVSDGDMDGDILEEWRTVHIKYQNSQWIVESINEFEGW